MEHIDLVTIPGRWDFEYQYFAGATASRFFNALRNEGRIYATHCTKCSRILVPARSFCDMCFVDTDGWIDLKQTGTLETFTIVGTRFPGLPDPPFVMGYVTLDGADTAILNRVVGVDLSDLDLAASQLILRPRVTARFAEERQGRITDFVFELNST